MKINRFVNMCFVHPRHPDKIERIRRKYWKRRLKLMQEYANKQRFLNDS